MAIVMIMASPIKNVNLLLALAFFCAFCFWIESNSSKLVVTNCGSEELRIGAFFILFLKAFCSFSKAIFG